MESISQIIKKIESELEIDFEDHSMDAVYKKLKSYIKSIHPDNFTDEEIIKQNENQTKKATEFLTIIKREIEKAKTKDIVPQESNSTITENIEYQNIIQSNEIIKLRSEIRDISKKYLDLKKERQNLRNEIERLQTDKQLKNEIRMVRKHTPSKSNLFASMGSLSLLVIYNIINRIEQISAQVLSKLPINELTLNISLFVIFLTTLLVLIYRSRKAFLIKEFYRKLKTQKFIDSLKPYLEKSQIAHTDIQLAIFERLQISSKIKRFQYRFFGLDKDEIIEDASEVVSDYLISKNFIDKINIKNLTQFYKLKEVTYRDLWIAERELES